MTKEKRIVVLTHEQWRELASLLWECSTETDDGMQYLREDLSTAAIWRAVVDAPSESDLLKSIAT
jgi:hypothetical protein